MNQQMSGLTQDATHLLIQRSKALIEHGDTEACQTFLAEMFGVEDPVDWVYVFQKVYLHACLRGNSILADWFETVAFTALDPIQQMGVRQVFAYGRTLLRRSLSRDSYD